MPTPTTVKAIASDRDALRGVALMACAALIIPGADAFAKLLASEIGPFQVGFLRYGIQTLLLVLYMVLRGRPIITTAALQALPKLALAGVLMGLAAAFLFWALRTMPLADATAILFVGPLILTILSAVILAERVGVHRVGAVLVGLLGAMIVMRPNWIAFGWHAILPFIAACLFAGVLITLRSVTVALDSFRIQIVAGGCAAASLGAMLAVGVVIDEPMLSVRALTAEAWLFALGLGAVGLVFQILLTNAVKYAEASLVAPIQYVEIVSATLLGYLVFGDFPDRFTILGIAIILSAGLYVVHREQRLARARQAAQAAVPLG